MGSHQWFDRPGMSAGYSGKDEYSELRENLDRVPNEHGTEHKK
jgi:hypothetical protein